MTARTSSLRLALARIALLLVLLGTRAAVAGATPGHHPVRVAGTVSAVDPAAGTFTVTPQGSAAVTLKTTSETQLFLDGAPIKLSRLAAGATARALYDAATKVAQRVEAHSAHAMAAVEGKVTAVASASLTIAPEDGSPVTLATDSSTKVSLNGAPAPLSRVAVGDEARALFNRTTLVAADIEAESPRHRPAVVEGQVTAVGASSITIAPEEGPPVMLATDSSTKVFLDGEPAQLFALAVGDQAHALYDRATMVAALVLAQSPHHELLEVSGPITAASATSITITPEEGSAVTLSAGSSTKVFLDGAPSTFSALAVGDQSRALYDSATMTAVVVQAQSPHHQLAAVEGQVTAVSATSITITPDHSSGGAGAAAVVLVTSSTTQIFLDASVSTLAAIAVGDHARALYDSSTMAAIIIQAESQHHQLAEIEGSVTAVGSATLTIAPEDHEGGAPVTLSTGATTLIFLDGRPAHLSSLATGDRARALYDSSTMTALIVQAESGSEH